MTLTQPDSPSDSPSLVLGKADGGSWVEDCSELEGGSAKREGLPLLLVSLVKTADWLVPLLWMGLEVQSSPGCFFWMSAEGDGLVRVVFQQPFPPPPSPLTHPQG